MCETELHEEGMVHFGRTGKKKRKDDLGVANGIVSKSRLCCAYLGFDEESSEATYVT